MRPKYVKIEIEFHDHCIGDSDEIICRVVGYILKETKTYIKLSFWLVDTEDEKIRSDNLEPFSIRKSTIIKRRVLK